MVRTSSTRGQQDAAKILPIPRHSHARRSSRGANALESLRARNLPTCAEPLDGAGTKTHPPPAANFAHSLDSAVRSARRLRKRETASRRRDARRGVALHAKR